MNSGAEFDGATEIPRLIDLGTPLTPHCIESDPNAPRGGCADNSVTADEPPRERKVNDQLGDVELCADVRTTESPQICRWDKRRSVEQQADRKNSRCISGGKSDLWTKPEIQ